MTYRTFHASYHGEYIIFNKKHHDDYLYCFVGMSIRNNIFYLHELKNFHRRLVKRFNNDIKNI